MALIERTPLQEPSLQLKEPELKFPEVTLPVAPPAPPTKKAVWPRIVGWTAAGLAGVGVVVALGIGAVNMNDIDSLQSDVRTLQNELSTTQDQLTAVRMDMILQRSGYGLTMEHLAQAPTTVGYGLAMEHLAQAPTVGYGPMMEHLAQAPTT